MEETIEKFIGDQLSVWPLAAEHYRALKKAETKHLTVNGLDITVQLNPARSISSKAALDPESIRRRPCFLCPENRPEEQFDIPFEGRKGKKYRITLNPFPIFPSHLVISSAGHIPQRIGNRYQDIKESRLSSGNDLRRRLFDRRNQKIDHSGRNTYYDLKGKPQGMSAKKVPVSGFCTVCHSQDASHQWGNQHSSYDYSNRIGIEAHTGNNDGAYHYDHISTGDLSTGQETFTDLFVRGGILRYGKHLSDDIRHFFFRGHSSFLSIHGFISNRKNNTPDSTIKCVTSLLYSRPIHMPYSFCL